MLRINVLSKLRLRSQQILTVGVAMACFRISKGASRYEVSIMTLSAQLCE